MLVLEGCTIVWFTQKGGTEEEEEASVSKTEEDLCTKFTDKYRLPFPISTLVFSNFFFLGSRTRTVIQGTLHARFVQSLPTPRSVSPPKNNRDDHYE